VSGYNYNFTNTSSIVIFGEDTLETSGCSSAFVAKIDSNGDYVWIKEVGGSQFDCVLNSYSEARIVYDPYSNTLILMSKIIGYYPRIGACDMEYVTLINRYLTALDLDGNCLWSTRQGAWGDRLVLDGHGSMYAIAVSNGTTQLNGSVLPDGIHMIKLSTVDGATKMVKQIGIEGELNAYMIGHQMNHLYLRIWSANSTWQLDTAIVNTSPNCDAIARLDTLGNVEWVRTINSGPSHYGYMDVDLNGVVAVVGTYSDSVYFDEGYSLVNNDVVSSVYMLKISELGELISLTNIDRTGYIGVWGVSCLSDGRIVCGLWCNDAVQLGGQSYGTTKGEAHYLVTHLNSDGSVDNVISAASNGTDVVSIQRGHGGLFYFVGAYEQPFQIGTQQVNVHYGHEDLFIAAIDNTLSIGSSRVGSSELYIYANPTMGECNITIPEEFLTVPSLSLRIMDSLGRLVSEQTVFIGQNRIQINLVAQAKGVYNASLSNGSKVFYGRIVFE
jgi:hypothetical protein